MRLEPSPHLSKSQRSAESRGFLRVLRFPPTGKVDRVGLVKLGPTVIGIRCCGISCPTSWQS
jgi:hypothetical protein